MFFMLVLMMDIMLCCCVVVIYLNVLGHWESQQSHAASNENQDNPSHLDSNTNTTTSDTTSQSSTRSFQLVPDTSDKSSNTPGAHTGWCYS